MFSIVRFFIYYDRVDIAKAPDLSDSEWQFLEVYFEDQVKLFKNAKIARERPVTKLPDI